MAPQIWVWEVRLFSFSRPTISPLGPQIKAASSQKLKLPCSSRDAHGIFQSPAALGTWGLGMSPLLCSPVPTLVGSPPSLGLFVLLQQYLAFSLFSTLAVNWNDQATWTWKFGINRNGAVGAGLAVPAPWVWLEHRGFNHFNIQGSLTGVNKCYITFPKKHNKIIMGKWG